MFCSSEDRQLHYPVEEIGGSLKHLIRKYDLNTLAPIRLSMFLNYKFDSSIELLKKLSDSEV